MMKKANEILKAYSLFKSYGETRALDGISLSIRKGSICGLIGPNGAGKSTFIRSVMGFLHPDAGSISIFGQENVTADDLTVLRQRIGYMAAVDTLPGDMKVRDVLKLSASLYKKECSEKAEKLCQRLNLNPEKRVRELSLGNTKKAAIVCALQHDPELLILDEPTSGLDPVVQKTFYELLREEQKRGVSILFSSHNLSEVQSLCDSILCIDHGKILFDGPANQLTSDSLYHVQTVKETDAAVNIQKYLYQGKAADLLKDLAAQNLDDVEIGKPSLEDVFFQLLNKEKQHDNSQI